MRKISERSAMLPSEVAATDLKGITDVSATTNGSKKITERASALVANIMGYYTDTGVDDAYAVSTGLSLSALTAGMLFMVKVTTANTGACTLAVDSAGAIAVKVATAAGLVDPTTNQISAGAIAWLQYDGTVFQLINPATA